MRKKQNFLRLSERTNIKQDLLRFLPAIAMIAFCTLNTFAAGGVVGALDTVASQIGDYVGGVQKLIYAIAAVIAVVGAFNIYHKMTNGDQDVKKTIMLTIGGCIALIALSTALPSIFGYSGTAS